MLGAIIGDIVGSVYEWNRIKTKDFPFLCHVHVFFLGGQLKGTADETLFLELALRVLRDKC